MLGVTDEKGNGRVQRFATLDFPREPIMSRVGCIALLVCVMVDLLPDNRQAEWPAAMDEAARVALHPHPIAFVPANATTLATERTPHPQPADRHENSHERTDETEQNKNAFCDETYATQQAVALREERGEDDGEQNGATNFRQINPESKWHKRSRRKIRGRGSFLFWLLFPYR